MRRGLTAVVLLAWAAHTAYLLRSVLAASPVALAADLARYGSSAQWKGVYYRGEKIGFTVGQTTPLEDGYEIREDGRLQMTLFGATTAVRLTTVARVGPEFDLRTFSFSLDPGSGPTEITGRVDGRRLELRIKTPSGERSETRELESPPALQMNLARRLAAQGLRKGLLIEVPVFDPATLRNAPLRMEVGPSEVVWVARRPVPAYRVESRYSGLTATSWITDTGDILREESATGLLVVKEAAEAAQTLAVPRDMQVDLLEAAALAPRLPRRIDDPSAVRRLRVRLTRLEGFDPEDLAGDGQTREGDQIEVREAQSLSPGPRDAAASRFLAAEAFLESDAPEIRAAAAQALHDLPAGASPRARAERLVRHVNAILEKKPTVSLPSALEVLRTGVGDCNEHTALLVALARASGIPARVAVGLVHLRGAFYYHAWAEVYLEEGGGGLWLRADPTLNQFPADATHIRLSRGGLEKQAAILGFVGQAKMSVVDLDLDVSSNSVLVGAEIDRRPLHIPLPRRDGVARSCWARPRPAGGP